MLEHTCSGPSPVGRLLGDSVEHCWEHILPLPSKQMSNSLLHCLSSPPVMVTPVLLRNCGGIVLFTNSHNDIVSWLMAAQPHPQCPLNNKRLLTKASERAKQK